MTVYVADIASYQGALTPTSLLAAGFTGVNVKISHGLTQKAVHPNARAWLSDARFTRSTFHYLTADTSGQEQAGYAYSRLRELCPTGPVAHVVDVEQDGVTQQIFEDYVTTMTLLLNWPIILYTGDWYAASRPWIRQSALTPWLWAAPNAGYLSGYPGDSSSHWSTVGYGGWSELSVMQYQVGPISGIDVSMSALRSAPVWDAMRGVTMAWALVPTLVNLRNALNKKFPTRDHASDGTIGDAAHQTEPSGHNPDDTPGSLPEDQDSDSVQDVRALDVDSDLKLTGWDSNRLTDVIVARMKALGSAAPLKYIIANGYISEYSNGWAWAEYDGSDPHDTHMHFSCRPGAGSGTGNPENYSGTWGFEGADMDEASISQAVVNKIHGDLANAKTGLAQDLGKNNVDAAQVTASKLGVDLGNDASGISINLSKLIDKRVAAALAPVTSSLAEIKALLNPPAKK